MKANDHNIMKNRYKHYTFSLTQCFSNWDPQKTSKGGHRIT